MVVHNYSTWEAEAGGLRVKRQSDPVFKHTHTVLFDHVSYKVNWSFTYKKLSWLGMDGTCLESQPFLG